MDAHSGGSAQPARPRAAQVAHGTWRTDRGGRAAVQIDVPIKILWSSNQMLRMECIMLPAPFVLLIWALITMLLTSLLKDSLIPSSRILGICLDFAPLCHDLLHTS